MAVFGVFVRKNAKTKGYKIGGVTFSKSYKEWVSDVESLSSPRRHGEHEGKKRTSNIQHPTLNVQREEGKGETGNAKTP